MSGQPPQTDEEAHAIFRHYWPAEQAAQHIAAYDRLRTAGLTPGDAAIRTMTDALTDQRRKLAGLLGKN